MIFRSRLAIGCFLFAAAASLCWAQPRPPQASAKLKARLGDKTLAILKGPTKVEVFRLDPVYSGKDDDKHFIGYPIKATGKEQGSEFGLKLATLLLQDKAWFNPDRFVPPIPLVGYRISKDKAAVDVVYDGWGRVYLRSLGSKTKPTTGDCFPLNAGFVKLAVEAFPDDEELKMFAKSKGK